MVDNAQPMEISELHATIKQVVQGSQYRTKSCSRLEAGFKPCARKRM